MRVVPAVVVVPIPSRPVLCKLLIPLSQLLCKKDVGRGRIFGPCLGVVLISSELRLHGTNIILLYQGLIIQTLAPL